MNKVRVIINEKSLQVALSTHPKVREAIGDDVDKVLATRYGHLAREHLTNLIKGVEGVLRYPTMRGARPGSPTRGRRVRFPKVGGGTLSIVTKPYAPFSKHYYAHKRKQFTPFRETYWAFKGTLLRLFRSAAANRKVAIVQGVGKFVSDTQYRKTYSIRFAPMTGPMDQVIRQSFVQGREIAPTYIPGADGESIDRLVFFEGPAGRQPGLHRPFIARAAGALGDEFVKSLRRL